MFFVNEDLSMRTDLINTGMNYADFLSWEIQCYARRRRRFIIRASRLTHLTCPSCHAKKVVQFGEVLRENTLYPVPHRQYVFSISIILRKFFLYNRSLLAKLATCAADSLLTFFRSALDLKDGICGAVMTIQTFGDYAKWQTHIHSIVADGLFRRSGMFYVMPKINISPVADCGRIISGQCAVNAERRRPDR